MSNYNSLAIALPIQDVRGYNSLAIWLLRTFFLSLQFLSNCTTAFCTYRVQFLRNCTRQSYYLLLQFLSNCYNFLWCYLVAIAEELQTWLQSSFDTIPWQSYTCLQLLRNCKRNYSLHLIQFLDNRISHVA